ncbi:yqaJ domain-containing protein [Trichonephila clavipes]|nr:yqaJ domain-containing protein [Trichonephila clavipes]
MENHLSKLKVQNIYDLESETRGQASSERWRYERSLRLSSSFFKEIACRKKSTPCSKLVMRIVYGRDLCNAALKYGLANEEIARKQYEREYSTEVKICGLFVDKDKPFLCASPDGLVEKVCRGCWIVVPMCGSQKTRRGCNKTPFIFSLGSSRCMSELRNGNRNSTLSLV